MRRQQGFTLIELVVVMVIIAVFFIAVGINLGSGPRQFKIKKMSKQVYAKMLLAQEEAILRGKVLGLSIKENVEFDNDEFKQEHFYDLQWMILEFDKNTNAASQGVSSTVAVNKNIAARTWRIMDENILKSMQVPVESLNLELLVEGQNLTFNDEDRKSIFEREEIDLGDEDLDDDEKQKVPSPLIYFLPNGEVSEFELSLIDNNDTDQGFLIVGESGGTIDFAFLHEEDDS